SAESRLLFASAKTTIAEADESTIRAILERPVDWTLFAQTAIEKGVVSRVAHTLLRVAPDMIPDDILGAMRTILEQTRSRNREVLDKVARMIEGKAFAHSASTAQAGYSAAEKALALNPSDASAWHTLGRVFFDLDVHDAAIACLSRTLELAP